MFFDRRPSDIPVRRPAWVSLAVVSALLLTLGLAIALTQFQALAQPADRAVLENPAAPTAVITSQIRSPNRDGYITARGSIRIEGIAWQEGSKPPYLTSDLILGVSRTTDRAYLLTWSPLDSAAFYLVEEATNPQFGDAETIFFGDGTEHPHTQDSDGTFYYRVKAQAAGGDISRWSNVVSVTVPWTEDSVTNLSPDITANSAVTVQVRMGEPDNIEGSIWHTAEITETSWGWHWSYDWQLPERDDTPYLIQTQASQDGTGFGPVDTITVTVDNQTYFVYLPLLAKRWPPRPYDPDLQEIENPYSWVDYTLLWSYSDSSPAVPDPEEYTVQEADNSSFSNPKTYTVPGAQTYLDISDEQREKHDGTYYYRVRGRNEYGPGEWSNVEMTVLRVSPRAPSLNPINNADEDGEYTVSWAYTHTYPPEPGSYILQEARDANFTVDRQDYEIKDKASKTFTEKGDGTYYYRVRGRNDYSLGTWSNPSGPVTVSSFSYFDDFSDPGSGWPSLVDDERWAFYEVDSSPPTPGDGSPYPRDGNGYFIARRSGGEPLARFSPGVAVPSNNYEIEVDTRWWDARWYATYQILFGGNESLSNYYAVRVMIDDIENLCKFSLVKRTGSGTTVLNDGWVDVEEIHCGERRKDSSTPWNHWRIRREDEWIKVHVNGTFLGQWKDASYGANRYFGVRCTLYEGFTPSKPEYDNFSVELLD